MVQMIKPPPEVLYSRELEALRAADQGQKPANWLLSPQAICTFILGSRKPIWFEGQEIVIEQKFYGDDALIERCIITLAGSRGLMLVGEPGTAKTMLSELLSAAVSGTSLNTVQGTAGTSEESIKYSWHYPLLLSNGPIIEALVPAPIYTGMSQGVITRFEEITRTASEVQDSLISIMSDKILLIPELGQQGVLYATPGFNVIATANTRDRGVHEMSSALKRRFNFETVHPIRNVKLEGEIIKRGAKQQLEHIVSEHPDDVIQMLATIFLELREGITREGHRIDKPGTVMSTAEATSVYTQSVMSAYYYGKSRIEMGDIVQHLARTIVKDSSESLAKLEQYFQTVIKARSVEVGGRWTELYEARTLLR